MALTVVVRFILFCASAVNEFLDRNCPHLAAAISFYALLSLFPLTLAIISAMGFILGSRAMDGQLAQEIGAVVPVSQGLVTDTVEGVVRSRNITGIAGIIGLLWASSAVFGAVRKGVNRAWGISRPRPFLQERFIDFSLTAGAGLFMLVSISTTAALSFFEEISGRLWPELATNGDFLWNRVAAIIPAFLSMIAFTFLYWLLPNTRVRVRDVLPGALAATVAFELVKNAFVIYLKDYSTYSVVYGTISATVALMIWLYVSAIILLFCALLTSRYAAFMEERAARRRWERVFTRSQAQPVLASARKGNGFEQ